MVSTIVTTWGVWPVEDIHLQATCRESDYPRIDQWCGKEHRHLRLLPWSFVQRRLTLSLWISILRLQGKTRVGVTSIVQVTSLGVVKNIVNKLLGFEILKGTICVCLFCRQQLMHNLRCQHFVVREDTLRNERHRSVYFIRTMRFPPEMMSPVIGKSGRLE